MSTTTKRAPSSSAHVERYDYDVRELRAGDLVDVFIEARRRWERGTFYISTAGMAFVETRERIQLRFEQALLMGLRRLVDDERPPDVGRRAAGGAAAIR